MRTHLRTSVTVILGMAALVIGSAASAHTTEPVVPSWKLDAAKSTYKPGPAPKSSMLTIAGKGLKIAVNAVNTDGSPFKWRFTTLA